MQALDISLRLHTRGYATNHQTTGISYACGLDDGNVRGANIAPSKDPHTSRAAHLWDPPPRGDYPICVISHKLVNYWLCQSKNWNAVKRAIWNSNGIGFWFKTAARPDSDEKPVGVQARWSSEVINNGTRADGFRAVQNGGTGAGAHGRAGKAGQWTVCSAGSRRNTG
jgi:hypothetical protein